MLLKKNQRILPFLFSLSIIFAFQENDNDEIIVCLWLAWTQSDLVGNFPHVTISSQSYF